MLMNAQKGNDTKASPFHFVIPVEEPESPLKISIWSLNLIGGWMTLFYFVNTH